MKKIVIFYPHIDEYGGIERNIIGLSIKILDKGFIPVLLCFYDRIQMNNYQEGLQVEMLGDHWNPLVKSKQLQQWLLKNKGSILGLPLFFSGKAGFYAAWPFRKSYTYALHFTDPPSLLKAEKEPGRIIRYLSMPRTKFASWLTAKGVKCADVCLTMTYWNAKELHQSYSRNFEVIYQGGVPPITGKHPFRKRCMGNTLRLFSICRLTYSKNLHWILLAAKNLQERFAAKGWFEKLEIVIAGKGPDLDKLIALTRDLKLEQYVRFPGFLNEEEVEEEYRWADLFLVPARQGYGLPVLEALYRYIPVVQNRESRISEMLAENAWVAVSDDHITSFTDAIEAHVTAIREHYPDETLLEDLMTEDKWATYVGKSCTWW